MQGMDLLNAEVVSNLEKRLDAKDSVIKLRMGMLRTSTLRLLAQTRHNTSDNVRPCSHNLLLLIASAHSHSLQPAGAVRVPPFPQ